MHPNETSYSKFLHTFRAHILSTQCPVPGTTLNLAVPPLFPSFPRWDHYLSEMFRVISKILAVCLPSAHSLLESGLELTTPYFPLYAFMHPLHVLPTRSSVLWAWHKLQFMFAILISVSPYETESKLIDPLKANKYIHCKYWLILNDLIICKRLSVSSRLGQAFVSIRFLLRYLRKHIRVT